MIEFQRLEGIDGNAMAFVLTIDGKESMDAFRQLVFRATNLWPDAPAEIKEFADKVEHGRVLQDYASQDTSPSGKLKATARRAAKNIEEDIIKGRVPIYRKPEQD